MTRSAIILRFLLHNQRIRLRHWLARSGAFSGSLSLNPEQAASYARRVFDHYCTRGALTPAQLTGKRILELGPDDNLGVAVLFAAAGADVVTLDKFRYSYDTPHQAAVLRTLGLSHSLRARVRPLCSLDLQHAAHWIEAESFDYIVSNAVLEELPHPDATFAAMHRALRRGGVMLHQVDLSDYGMFSQHGFAPQEFLTVSDTVYRAMTRESGGPNRHLTGYYRRQLSTPAFDASIAVTSTYAGGPEASAQVERIRPRLLPRYRNLPAEELLTHGIFIVARKT